MKTYPATPQAFFMHFVKRYRYAVSGIMGLAFVSVLCSKFAPYIFSRLVDLLADNRTFAAISSGVVVLLLLYLITALAAVLFRRGAMFIFQYLEPALTRRIKREMTTYILGHSISYMNDQLAGKVAGRVQQISDKTLQLLWFGLFSFYLPAINFLITFFMLCWVNLLFGGVLLIWFIVLGFVLVKSSDRVKKYASVAADTESTVNGLIVDSISNVSLVKSFARLRFEQNILRPKLRAEQQADRILISKIENNKVLQSATVLFFNVMMLILAVFLWDKGFISAGDIVFVLLLITNMGTLFEHFMFVLLDWNKAIGILRNALMVVSTPHQIEDKEDCPELSVKKGTIDFVDVSFAYNSGKKVFNHFNLHIKSGERVGLVGISGSGKTTLVNLLQRFYDVQRGKILIDGQNISDVCQESLHRAIAVIPQDTTLFHRSLAENIAYGNPNASHRALLAASKKAYADDFIQKMPEKYMSQVGDRGVKLSGGQRQRIAIARAILKNAPILILDEATSALDSESELFIQKSMSHLMRGKTVIAIAHRLSTLREMDRIIVMSKGRILEEGTPDQLLKNNGKYAKLWRMQTLSEDKS